ncbi:glycoside hydrolase superfamily [Mycena leptocephala]|nr:glycoside hydrolase superfamily [Mycena leptocephala]
MGVRGGAGFSFSTISTLSASETGAFLSKEVDWSFGLGLGYRVSSNCPASAERASPRPAYPFECDGQPRAKPYSRERRALGPMWAPTSTVRSRCLVSLNSNWYMNLMESAQDQIIANTYDIHYLSRRSNGHIQQRVKFTERVLNGKTITPPNSVLLGLHAACTRIAHMSGAAAILDEFDRDIPPTAVLTQGFSDMRANPVAAQDLARASYHLDVVHPAHPMAIYWGQNSYSAAFPNAKGSQQDLGIYCQDSNVNIIPIAFVNEFFGRGGVPVINLADSCQNSTFPGTDLLDCSGLSGAISSCQDNGILVTISLGGADSTVGGESDTRPFGSAILDGVDLDIEQGSPVGYAAFVDRIRALSAASDKRYYISAAPQCQFPDAYLGHALNTVGFDMIYVQVECGLDTSNWNFNTWDTWAQNQSQNSNVKIYIGAAASESAAGSGYVSASILGDIASNAQRTFSSFAGVMLWDMSQAYQNEHYHVKIKKALNPDDNSTMELICSSSSV